LKKTICIVSFLVLITPAISAQSRNSDRCVVTIANMKTKNATQLGVFTTTIAEEELTTKAFRLPHTRLFIVASVFYTDESMASKKGADSVSLELALSRRRARNVLRSLAWAEAEIPLNGFDVGRVTLMVKTNGQSQLVLMECKENVRR
jgi:hypothetical protein